ncbi:UNVERIFIED_CONTAM: hypothetical protein FKN15_006436 [Acipenser sinensis]
MVYGVVHKPDADSRREVVVREWSANQLTDEMNYIKEVRVSLEKVRERMYGEFGGIQQKMQQLSQDIRVANSQRQSLQSEVKVKTAALESYDQMSSSLTSVTIDLQKSLVDSSLERNDMRQEMRSLKESYENAVEKLKEKERQLEAAQTENETLKLKEQSQLQRSLQENEQQRQRLRQTDEIDGPEKSRRTQLLEEEASSLRERIKHLDDLVHNQQRKVKQMIGEVRSSSTGADCGEVRMAASWTERQGHLVDLHNKSKEELRDIFNRQEKLLSNKRFVQTLPDKGKKISDFVEKVRSALAHIEDVERTKDMLSTVKIEFESRFTPRSTIMEKEHGYNTIDISTSQTQLLKTFINSSKTENKYTKQNGDTLATAETILECIDVHMPQNNCDTPAVSLTRVNMETATTSLLGQPVYGVKINSALKNDEELAQVFEKVTLADETEVMAGLDDTRQETVSIGDNRQNNNPFGINQPQKKPHYIEVFEKAEKNPAVGKSKFKPNQGNSCFFFQEVQATVAAQKLAEKLNVRMVAFNPEGEAMVKYREVRDDGDIHSSEDD